MEAFLVSVFAVAIAEIGDKTQLLALLLAVRFRRVAPVLGGILIATLIGNTVAASIGAAAAQWLEGDWFRWLLAASFVAIGLWTLKPDDQETHTIHAAGSAFTTAMLTFALAEMADKTQIATVMLAANFGDALAVTAGATVGMMAVNGPTVWLGRHFAARLPMRAVRVTAGLVFIGLGLWLALR